MTSYIFLIIIALLVIILIDSGILYGITKVFKFNEVSYKKSLFITLGLVLASLIIKGLFNLINLGTTSSLLAGVLTFISFHFLLKKFYGNSWLKSLGIYLLNGVIVIIIGLVIAIPIRLYVFEPFVASGQSMNPNINQGDYLFINKLTSKYKRDDVVVMINQKPEVTDKPDYSSYYLIKRIVGLPTEKVEIKNGQIFVNGSALNNKYIATPIQGDSSVTLSENEYYVLGDNPSVSLDSRVFGPVKASNIIGKIIQ